MLISPLARALCETAHDAGRVILRHYSEGTDSRSKADSSPVTAADEEAEALILARLAAIEPATPIIAEEEVAAGRVPRSAGDSFWSIPSTAPRSSFRRTASSR